MYECVKREKDKRKKMINTNAVGQKRCWTKRSKASKSLMVSLIISLLKCTTNF